MLISDGDVSGVIATSEEDSGVDMYMGTGGSPEGVLGCCCSKMYRWTNANKVSV